MTEDQQQNINIPSGKSILLHLLQTTFATSLSLLEQRSDEQMISLSATSKSFSEFTSILDKMTQETEETIQQRKEEEERIRKEEEEKKRKEEEEKKKKEEEEKKKKEETKTRASKSVGRESRPGTSKNRSVSSLTTPAKRGKSTKKETNKSNGTNSMQNKNEKTKTTNAGRISSFKAEEEANNRKKALSKSKTDHNIMKKDQKGRHTIGVSSTKKTSTKKKSVKENIKDLNIKQEGDGDTKGEDDNKYSKTEPAEPKQEEPQEQEPPKEEEKVIEIPRNPPEYYINNYVNEKFFNTIFSYLPIQDQLSFVSTSKQFKQHYITILSNLETSITDTLNLPQGQTLDDKIKDAQSKSTPPDDPSHPYPEFQVTKGALKAIELCNGDSYNKLFKKTVLEPKLMDIIVIYRILFRLIGENVIADVDDDAEFWVKCCEFLSEKCPDNKVGTFIIESSKNLVFDDKTVYKINKLITQKKAKIVPAVYSKICSTTGLLVFLIKDSLEYCGIMYSDKKTPALRVLNNLLYLKELLERMKKIKEFVEGF